MNYTKGEWRICPISQPGWRHLIATESSPIEIAKIYLRGKNPDEESLANAHLIAAAPAMYEALKALMLDYQGHNLELNLAQHTLILKAISKAEAK
jgi:hypothetical protein